MKIQYCSDLHIEFPENKKFLKDHPIQAVGDLLIIAGDLVPFKLMDQHKDFFNFCSDHFQQTYWIPGNHEYYGSDITQKSGTFHEKIKSNVHLLNNKVVTHHNVNFLFTTLWTSISPAYQWEIERGMSDFHHIKFGKFRLTIDRINTLYQENIAFLKQALQENKAKINVVTTHHVPTFQHYPLKYKDSLLNQAFAVELMDFIAQYQPNYWIYGHHHQNTKAFTIDNTQLLTNQLGYVEMNEFLNFKTGKIINLKNL